LPRTAIITSATDNVNGNWTYSYDQFNRLTGSTQNLTPQTYVYDRYGNRLQQGSSTYVFDNNNHISGSGVVYDALGNVTNDGFHTYAYDAESRLTKVDGNANLTYQYDAEGRRVHAPTYESIYDLNGRATTLLTLSGLWAYSEIYAGGRHLATYSNATTYFLQTDWLGTRRVATDPTAAVKDTCIGLPFGDGINCVGTEVNFNRFTDYVHDSESNLEHTLFRQYSSTQGRFLTPDPFTGSMDPGNPQSMNRYPYVAGNPINFTDPLGLLEDGDMGPFGNGCTLLSGMPDEAFGCPGGGFNVGGDISSLLGRILHGSGLGGNTVPGNCFLPGACPSLPIPSILDFLPHIPGPGCDPGPCSDNSEFSGGNGFLQSDTGALQYAKYQGQRLLDQLAQLPKRIICASSPDALMKRQIKTGTVSGALSGAIWGAGAGASALGVGAVPGAIIGGGLGAVSGTGAGIFRGAAMAEACRYFGAYR
jgi:RHS repeat-associated protein